MQPKQKTYEAMIWETPSSIGKRVTVTAENLIQFEGIGLQLDVLDISMLRHDYAAHNPNV